VTIIFASSEIRPYAITGGLGEVSYSLPVALHRNGLRVIRVMPMYRSCLEGSHPVRDTGMRLKIPVGFQVHTAEVWTDDASEPVTYFVRRDEYFDRRGVYGLPERDYDDNFERFIFFQKAVIALVDEMGLVPDILHCNDWATALIPLYLSFGLQGMGRNKGATRSVFSIHNLAYQGSFGAAEFSATNLPFSCFSIRMMEFYGKINCLKAGLMSSEAVTTVSQGYAREILTPEHGCGLDGVLRDLGDRFQGITNGADYALWDPSTDPRIARTYSKEDLSGKAECKQDLFKRLGLSGPAAQGFLLTMVTRMVDQKGLDLLSDIMPRLMEMPVRLAILGTGEPRYHSACQDWMKRWPGRFHATLDFDDDMAHALIAGADAFLMPSRFEPCGLAQLHAKRYGTLPIVHHTGGLLDTVEKVTGQPPSGTGFAFDAYSPEAFLGAVTEAERIFRLQNSDWERLMLRAMSDDHSWSRAAGAYTELYRKVLAEPPRPLELH
jgi:starch synthase